MLIPAAMINEQGEREWVYGRLFSSFSLVLRRKETCKDNLNELSIIQYFVCWTVDKWT